MRGQELVQSRPSRTFLLLVCFRFFRILIVVCITDIPTVLFTIVHFFMLGLCHAAQSPPFLQCFLLLQLSFGPHHVQDSHIMQEWFRDSQLRSLGFANASIDVGIVTDWEYELLGRNAPHIGCPCATAFPQIDTRNSDSCFGHIIVFFVEICCLLAPNFGFR